LCVCVCVCVVCRCVLCVCVCVCCVCVYDKHNTHTHNTNTEPRIDQEYCSHEFRTRILSKRIVAGEPMHVSAIAREALEQGLLYFDDKMPSTLQYQRGTDAFHKLLVIFFSRQLLVTKQRILPYTKQDATIPIAVPKNEFLIRNTSTSVKVKCMRAIREMSVCVCVCVCLCV